MRKVDFSNVQKFEQTIADYFGAPHAVAIDSATHGIEICLRYKNADFITVPKRTYLSVPMLASKLNINLFWRHENWENFYYLYYEIVDAATYWKENGYIPGTWMNLSFQFQKHLSLGRGGMILLDDEEAAIKLRKMAYDGRIPGVPWREQNIDTMGYHYYMTPETAELGLMKFDFAKEREPRIWSYEDYPDISQMEVFK